MLFQMIGDHRRQARRQEQPAGRTGTSESAEPEVAPPPRRNAAATIGKVLAAVGWVALAYLLVVCVSACSVSIDPFGDNEDTPEPTDTPTISQHDQEQRSELRQALYSDGVDKPGMCEAWREVGSDYLAQYLNEKFQFDDAYTAANIEAVFTKECAS